MRKPAFQVKIWGARGSLPSPASPQEEERHTRALFEEFFARGYRSQSDIDKFWAALPTYRRGGYGGNTPCVEVRSPLQQLIIDGGSGIRLLGYEMMAGPCGQGKGEVHLLFTHFHWDHLIGLPFFTPIFIPGNVIHAYAVQSDLESVFKTVFKKPYFPVPLEQLGAKLVYHRLEPRKPTRIGDLTFTPYQLDHPDPCWGYRFEKDGKSYAHCVDTEAKRISREELGPDLPLYRNADLMVFDAQYTLMETVEKVNWGHAAASLGLDIAMREGIKRVVFMHHDPASSNEKIHTASEQARRYFESQLKRDPGARPVDWEFAREGMVIDV